MARTFNTLFMLSSLDGKISTGSIDARDMDKDLPKLKGIREGLGQYYKLEQRTDLHSLNTGRVMAKIGMNRPKKTIAKLPVSFIIIDNKPHLNATGIENLLKKCKTLYLVTNNRKHPAFKLEGRKNLKLLYYPGKINFAGLFSKLRRSFGIKRVTIQSGGTLNATLLRSGLIDEVSIVVAPALIGGKDTSTLVDGSSLRTDRDLLRIRRLKLKKAKVLKNSYLHLLYKVAK
jgi:2,5-diamino-6-(ribosylamino)-4(3H)-pyrimidinone 5'-phosphate reductase